MKKSDYDLMNNLCFTIVYLISVLKGGLELVLIFSLMKCITACKTSVSISFQVFIVNLVRLVIIMRRVLLSKQT